MNPNPGTLFIELKLCQRSIHRRQIDFCISRNAISTLHIMVEWRRSIGYALGSGHDSMHQIEIFTQLSNWESQFSFSIGFCFKQTTFEDCIAKAHIEILITVQFNQAFRLFQILVMSDAYGEYLAPFSCSYHTPPMEISAPSCCSWFISLSYITESI